MNPNDNSESNMASKKSNLYRTPFAVWLHAQRERLGISLEEFYRRTGLSSMALNRYARGSMMPTLKVAIVICKVLECPLQDLYDNYIDQEGLHLSNKNGPYKEPPPPDDQPAAAHPVGVAAKQLLSLTQGFVLADRQRRQAYRYLLAQALGITEAMQALQKAITENPDHPYSKHLEHAAHCFRKPLVEAVKFLSKPPPMPEIPSLGIPIKYLGAALEEKKMPPVPAQALVQNLLPALIREAHKRRTRQFIQKKPYVLLCGGEVIGYYVKADEALADGYRRFGDHPFLVLRLTRDSVLPDYYLQVMNALQTGAKHLDPKHLLKRTRHRKSKNHWKSYQHSDPGVAEETLAAQAGKGHPSQQVDPATGQTTIVAQGRKVIDYLIAQRLRQQVTADELARRCNRHPDVVRKMEYGQDERLSIRDIRHYAEHVGLACEVQIILQPSGTKAPPGKDVRQPG